MPINLATDREIMQLRTTAGLVRSYGRWITLFRPPEPLPDGAGGLVQQAGDPSPLEPQYVFFSAKAAQVPTESDSTGGEQVPSEHVIVGLPFQFQNLEMLDIQENDFFWWNNDLYYVKFIHHDKRYQIKADVRTVGT